MHVQILDCSGNLITTVTTDASGFYKYTQTICDPNSLNVAISVDNTQAALTGFTHTQVGVGSDTTDSDCGKGANANTSQCTTLTVANPTNLNRDCGFFVPSCNLDLEKTVALDDNCDGVPNGPFQEQVDQDINECVVYQVCVHNTGQQALDNVVITDPELGITVTIPSVAPGATECRLLPGQALTNTGSCASGSCQCGPTKVATGASNSASVTSATCHDSGSARLRGRHLEV